jgi:hypothetical protein
MQIKQINEMVSPDIWDLSATDDIILTRKDREDQRVLINYQTYQRLKQAISQLQQADSSMAIQDQFDLNPLLQDFIDILNQDQFEEITDDDNYFRNFARSIKSRE